MSEESRVSRAGGFPYERDVRANAQRRTDVKAMRESAWGSPPDRLSLLYST